MKIYLDTIGCRLNQSEIERMARQFRAAGHEIVASAEGADLAVVNTCAVTAGAASDSRGKVRQVARAGANQIVATGCWATLQPRQAAALPNVLSVVPNGRKDSLVADVLDLQPEAFDLEPLSREPLPGAHRRTRAFIKAQDGCDNRCTFCITTIARGRGRSRPIAEVIPDVRAALAGGAKEIVLTGVHLGSWGQDLSTSLAAGLAMHPVRAGSPPGRDGLRDLIKAILSETDVPRLRLSSLEPWDLDADFFSLWEDRRLCRHLHLPLQSGCAATLKRMARKTTPASFRELVAAARQIMPEAAITTDLIAGFPGETEAEFSESMDFVREMNFAGGHAFSYSPRPGTAAARMGGQVRAEVAKERNAACRALFEGSAREYRRKFIGRASRVLWESATQLDGMSWKMQGLTDNYVRVAAAAPRPLWNEISQVRLEAESENGLAGSIIF